MARLTVHTVETAPEAAKPRVEAALKNNGFLPNLIGVLANSPEALAFYQEVGKLNAATSLSAGEVEVVQIIAAKTNECGFCVAGHTKLATLKKLLSENAVAASRAVDPAAFDDAKLSALAAFTVAVMANKGAVSDADLQAFFRCGLQPAAGGRSGVGRGAGHFVQLHQQSGQNRNQPRIERFRLKGRHDRPSEKFSDGLKALQKYIVIVKAIAW